MKTHHSKHHHRHRRHSGHHHGQAHPHGGGYSHSHHAGADHHRPAEHLPPYATVGKDGRYHTTIPAHEDQIPAIHALPAVAHTDGRVAPDQTAPSEHDAPIAITKVDPTPPPKHLDLAALEGQIHDLGQKQFASEAERRDPVIDSLPRLGASPNYMSSGAGDYHALKATAVHEPQPLKVKVGGRGPEYLSKTEHAPGNVLQVSYSGAGNDVAYHAGVNTGGEAGVGMTHTSGKTRVHASATTGGAGIGFTIKI